MSRLARITRYPIKSLDGQDVAEAEVLSWGSLAFDRRFALVDRQGKFVGGKRTARVHSLRSEFEAEWRVVRLGPRDGAEPTRAFHLDSDRAELEAWLSQFFETSVTLMENDLGGYPDDDEAPGPTLISTATLEAVAGWFDLDVDDTRRRFRANLEIDGVEPFWEDRLVNETEYGARFRLGSAVFEGAKPCQRCVVPSRSPDNGAVIDSFAKRFAERRQATLPAWAPRGRFDHFYRLAVNTRLVSGGGSRIAVGDTLTIISPSE